MHLFTVPGIATTPLDNGREGHRWSTWERGHISVRHSQICFVSPIAIHSKSFCCDFFSSVLLLLVYGDVSLTAISHFTYTNGMRGQQQEQQQKHGERGRSIKYIISPLEWRAIHYYDRRKQMAGPWECTYL